MFIVNGISETITKSVKWGKKCSFRRPIQNRLSFFEKVYESLDTYRMLLLKLSVRNIIRVFKFIHCIFFFYLTFTIVLYIVAFRKFWWRGSQPRNVNTSAQSIWSLFYYIPHAKNLPTLIFTLFIGLLYQ